MENKSKNVALMTVTIVIASVNNIGFGSFDRVAAAPVLATREVQAENKLAISETLKQQPFLNTIALKQKVLPIQIFKPKIKPKPLFTPRPKVSPSIFDIINPAEVIRSRPDRGWTYLFTPDYLAQKIHIRVVSGTGTAVLDNTTTDKSQIATPNCNPNSVVATQSTLYVACNKDTGNGDRILAYDISNISQPTLSKTITSNQFNGLIALALDQGGNLWASNYGNGKITRISSSSLASASPQVDKALASSPAEPVGIAFDPDGSLWVASTYQKGLVVNISAADLNKSGLDIDANPRYCISNSISGCNPVANTFDFPEGVAVLNGAIWVANNGGDHPGYKMTALQVTNGQLNLKQIVGSSAGNPFSCPGGLFSDGTDLYINDQSFGLSSTGCGNNDGKATVDGVIKYGGGNLSNTPTVFRGTTSRPGFGGIALLKIQ
jgi:hypothetical protein